MAIGWSGSVCVVTIIDIAVQEGLAKLVVSNAVWYSIGTAGCELLGPNGRLLQVTGGD